MTAAVGQWFPRVRVYIWHPKVWAVRSKILFHYKSIQVGNHFMCFLITVLTVFIWTFDRSRIFEMNRWFYSSLELVASLFRSKYSHVFQIIGNCWYGSLLELCINIAEEITNQIVEWVGLFEYSCYLVILKPWIKWIWKMFVGIIVHAKC